MVVGISRQHTLVWVSTRQEIFLFDGPTGDVEDLGAINADQQIHVLEGTGVTSVSDPKPIATQYRLDQNYPNPFNPTTEISYSIPANAQVSMKVYDALGREVANLVDGYVTAGVHTVKFNASSLASGMYMYRLTAGTFTDSRKLVVLK
jgi:hypothetical protein